MAEQALTNATAFNVNQLGQAVEELLDSETLRSLANGQFTFRHDVLREWAIANLLFTDATMIERLPFARPASASLARGIELAARMMLERGTDSENWHSFFTTLSRDSAHGSWRRAALLALVHSEIGGDLLKRASSYLLADDAKALRELIRTMMAVDVEPITERLAAAGVDLKVIPANFDVPRGAGWPRLITWLLTLGKDLPATAIPDVVDGYTAWSTGTIGLDPLTPYLQQWIYYWLNEIEEAREGDWHNRRVAFGGALDREQFASLESDLRTGFLLFCNHTPELATQYLQSLMRRKYNDEAVRSVLKFRGALARAAPKELAEFTAAALIQEEEPEYEHRHRYEDAFGFIDHDFLPASPNQGPFLELLTAAPEHGLPLIRRLIDHDISFRTKGRAYRNNVMIISLPDGDRAFPWELTYMWSREKGTSQYCVKSALMALEAWAHRRIEAGEPFEKVLPDVLGQPGAPACYLLVAVDLLLSHWPKSREAMIPFLACPELLCIDRERHVHDGYEYPDIFGLKALQKEPSGTASSASLKDRASRRASLDEYIGYYAVNGPDELRDALTTLLRRAAERLGSPDAQSDLGDPVFMVVHALNLADPTNWPEVTVKLRDGSLTTACQYVPPQSEAEHLKPIQDAQQERQTDTNMQMALSLILDNPSRSSPELAAEAVNWAQGFGTKIQVNDEDGQKLREEAIYVAALVAVRDGNTELRAQHATWIRNTFARAMRTKDDPVHWVRDGLHFNPIAIAFVGMTFLLKDRATRTDLRAILKAAARENPAAAHGFAVTADALATIDERLPRAVMRCALAARIRPSRSAWDEPKKKAAGRAKQHRQRVKAAIDAELAWLDSKRAEPDWPQLPLEPARPKHRLRIPSGKQQHKEPAREYVHPDEYFEHQGGALWIRSAAKLYDVVKRPWLRDIARNYSAWTMTANGAGLDSNDDVAHPPREWDDAYFSLLAYCLPELDSAGIDELALAPIVSLPDESFFDAIAVFLRSIDEIHFNDKGLQEAQALHIRAALARRMMASRGWYWLARNRSYNIEIHIGPALAALFFNDYMMREAKCYLLQKGVDRVASFLPILQEMVTEGPCLFLALVTLNLVEVSPRPTHLPFMVAAGKTWLAGYPEDNTFWIDHGIGRRLCLWISAVLNLDRSTLAGNAVLRGDTEHLLAGLVRVGVSEARRLEEMLGLV